MLKLPTGTAVQRPLERKKILCYNLVPFILLSTIALHVTLFVDLLVALSLKLMVHDGIQPGTWTVGRCPDLHSR